MNKDAMKINAYNAVEIGKSGFFESSYATIKGLASTGGLLMSTVNCAETRYEAN